MRHALVATCLLALTACGTDRLSGTPSELRASPDLLRWEKAFLGFPVERSLQLENRGRVARSAEVTVEGPFSVASTVVDLPANATVQLTVLFEPTAPGHATGALTLTSEGTTLTIGLEGDAFEAPDCGAAAPCHAVTFDPATGTCVDTPLPDDTACSAPCVEGTCHGGECLGSTPTCDDGNACTQDACDPLEGCIHLDASASCVTPAVTCKVSFCDPQSGCGVTDAADGTPCGDADCVSADVCLNGQCRKVPVPEGSTCAPQSPCQAAGTCHQQQCVRPPPTPLQPAWTYTAPTTGILLFTGVADAQGNLYWAECLNGACELVSFTRDGFERYRVPLRGEIGGGALARGTVMLVGNSVAVASYDTVQLFRASDGVEEWFRNLRAELLPNAPPTSRLQVGPIVDLGQGRIAVRTVRFETDPQVVPNYQSILVALSTAQGRIDWVWRVNGYAEGLVAQADGTTWFFDYPVVSGTQPRLVALTRGGSLKFSVSSPGGKPLATYGNRIVLWGGGLASTLDASHVANIWNAISSGPMGVDPISPLLGDGVAYTVGNDWGRITADVALPGAYVRRFDPVTGDQLWAERLDLMGTPSSEWSTVTSQPALLADDGLLVARGDWVGATWQLLGITRDGSEAYACDLPMYQRYERGAVVAGGRWTTSSVFDGIIASYSVMSFDVPGVTLAPKGWVVLGGGPEGAGRPR